ncbi:condensation domain-containing protein [Streptomyces sp. CBMA123]|uniref:condensation domain-containing protein n=1 Tax=Streptomyces sp. CBMA123 TaxID=1896313 RepID=UPI0016619F35|nr:condensation domain-containing protein [Streptomyces sp. CBMA123]MBD0688855.1 hypothetical protein [Streptomyces sp. CBMA123]
MTAHQAPPPHAASAAEQRFWFAEQLTPGARANLAAARIHLTGPVDLELLQHSLDAVRQRHDALRTAFRIQDDQLVRSVRATPVTSPVARLAPGTTPDDAFTALAARPFDLDRADVQRAAIVQEDEEADLFLLFHHAVFDGLSDEVLAADLATAYAQGASTGTAPVLPQRRRSAAPVLRAERRTELVAKWRAVLDAVPDLPHEGAELSQRDLAMDSTERQRFGVPEELAERLRTAARGQAVSPYGLLLAAYGRALGEVGGATDFCVGIPVATRTAEQDDEVGCLLNTVPVRMRAPSTPGGLQRVWNGVIDAVDGVELPFDQIVRACRPQRTRRMPLYQALFTFQNWPRPAREVGGTQLRSVSTGPFGNQSEVLMELHDLGDGPLSGLIQAPTHGHWAKRLGDLRAAFDHHLEVLAENVEGDSR